jgi:tetratricopeptide (TPR) repeat protein
VKSNRVTKYIFAIGAAAVFLSATASAQTDPGQVAFTLEREGKLSEAEAAWSALAQQYPSNPEPLAHLGLIEAKQEHYTEAIKFYKRAMALNPAMPGLQLNLGIALFKAGDYEKTVAELGPLLKTHPDNQQLTILLGMSQYGLENFAAASPLLKQASDRDPQNRTLLLTLAHSCLLSRQYPCVVDAYHRLIALNAESAEVDMLVGEALDEMKDHEGAIREFRAAIAANPHEPNVHFGLGYLLWTRGQHQEAATEFRREIANDPHHLQAMLYLADTLILQNQNEEARPLLEQVGSIDPNIAMQHVDLGIVYADRGQQEAARAQFEAAIKLSPKNVNAHYRLARLDRSMGMTAQANAEFEKAKSLNKAEDDRLVKVMSTLPAGKDAGATKAPIER